MLAIIQIFRSETLDPKGPEKKNNKNLSLIDKKQNLAKLAYVMLYSLMYIVHATWWPMDHKNK
jgi:hypothetical protein